MFPEEKFNLLQSLEWAITCSLKADSFLLVLPKQENNIINKTSKQSTSCLSKRGMTWWVSWWAIVCWLLIYFITPLFWRLFFSPHSKHLHLRSRWFLLKQKVSDSHWNLDEQNDMLGDFNLFTWLNSGQWESQLNLPLVSKQGASIRMKMSGRDITIWKEKGKEKGKRGGMHQKQDTSWVKSNVKGCPFSALDNQVTVLLWCHSCYCHIFLFLGTCCFPGNGQ